MKFLTDNPIIAVIASGIVYAILLPPFSASTLAWVALVPLLMVLASSSPWRAFGYGALWALCATKSSGAIRQRAKSNYASTPRT